MNNTTQEFKLISYKEWLGEQDVISKHSDYSYSINYKGILCGVGVAIGRGTTFVTIRPVSIIDDIGGGAGTPIDFEFKESTTQEDNANAVSIQEALNKIYNQAIDHALDIVSASSALNFGNQDEMETYIVEQLEKLKS